MTIVVLNTLTNRPSTNCGATYSATRTWVATDACGNSAQCSQTVTTVDTTAPTMNCVGTNKTVELGSAWNFDAPTATDLSEQVASVARNTRTNRTSTNE